MKGTKIRVWDNEKKKYIYFTLQQLLAERFSLQISIAAYGN
jgi:hypothetical protein